MSFENISIYKALNRIAYLYKYIYFESMLEDKEQTIESFRKSNHRFLDGVISKIHDKYEDHIEGKRKETR